MKPQQFYNENPDAIGYDMDADVFERLKSVHYMIFKKGRSMTPDEWRDMENLLALALHNIEPIMENSSGYTYPEYLTPKGVQK